MARRVALIRQETYEPSALAEALRRAIDLAGFDLALARGRRVLLKPNMLGAYPPAMGVTTHPAFVREVGRIFREAGASVAVGDSGNGVHGIERTWEATGLAALCREAGLEEVRFEASGSVERDGLLIARAPLEAELVVNLPKFKTHGLMVLTLAAKNLFGCISGMQKFALHRFHERPDDFATTVVRIAEAVRPALTIIDGIVAMEGDGPSGGTLLDLGVIVAGTEVHAVDAACCRLIGIAPSELPTLAAAARLGAWDPAAAIELAGDPIEALRPQRFRLAATSERDVLNRWYGRLALRLIWSQAHAQPRIAAKRCRRCGLCVSACPAKAIDERGRGRPPRIAPARCIQCFCCHEICPYQAIDIRRGLPLRIARWLAERQMKRTATKEVTP